MLKLKYFFFIYLLIINLVTFITYLLDKRYAIKDKQRISEQNLMLLALLGGAFGAHLSMGIFRHKTKHLKFTINVPLLEIIWLIITFYYITKIYIYIN